MARYVLDTDTVIDAMRGNARVTERLAEAFPTDVAISVITLSELWYGVLRGGLSERNLSATRHFVRATRTLPFSRRAAMVHARLRHDMRAQLIGPHDMLIAATTLAAGAVLVTSNTREFSRVPELQVESWR